MKAIVLAAGKGTRLKSEEMELPKALRLVDGKPLIRYVLEGLSFLAQEDIVIVVGFMKERIMEAIGGEYRYATQQDLIGSAKAALCAEPVLGHYDGPVLVCYCDMPLLSSFTYRALFDKHIASGAGGTLLAGKTYPIPAYGRLIRDASGALIDIMEDSACTAEQKKIDEVNVGIQVFDGNRMFGWLREVTNDNPKGEYYLTGAVSVLARHGIRQEVVQLRNPEEMLGVNTMEDLMHAEAIVRGGRKADSPSIR